MNLQPFQLDYQDAESIAVEVFIQACGFQPENRNHMELLEEGLEVLKKIKQEIKLSGLLSILEPGVFNGHSIFIKDQVFGCTAFDQIPADNIIRIYAYLLTVGKFEFKTLNLVEQYYMDLWIKAFLEAGRELLRKQITNSIKKTSPQSYVTYPFGPGFYGMNANRLDDLFHILNGDQIGFAPNEREEISKKCCGGFFFIVKDETKLPAVSCRNCIGHEEGCLFCGGKNQTPNRESCLKLLKKYQTPSNVVRHCLAVTDVALRIAKALKEKGWTLDMDLLEGASLLHDIARLEENHGLKGSIIAEKHGFGQVANLIRCHMFYATDPYKRRINEQDILCLADRMVKEDQYVGIEKRMTAVLNKFKGDPLVMNRIQLRLEENRILQKRIEEVIGTTIDELMK